MAYAVVEYIREDGANPYRAWFESLDPQAAAKVATAVLRLEMGNTSRVKWIGTLGEYRIDWGSGVRIYLARDEKTLIILFGGGTKGRQQDDIRRAEGLFAEYKARKAATRRRKG
jgi:putative addiction module killer protein